jgi:hypothetical protein
MYKLFKVASKYNGHFKTLPMMDHVLMKRQEYDIKIITGYRNTAIQRNDTMITKDIEY